MKSLVKKLVVLSVAGGLLTLSGCGCCYKGYIGQNIQTMEAYSPADATIAKG